MTRIGFIRHGVTDWNMEGRAQGQADIPLNEAGRAQARALADRLQGEQWDVIYSSDLIRAKETAEIVAGALRLIVKTDKRLREKSCGLIEGTTEEDRVSKWGEDWRVKPLGIEEDEAVVARGLEFLSYITQTYPDQKVLIVSHGAFIGLTLKKLLPQDDKREHLHNTSVTLLKRTEDCWECELYNCAKHIV
jgi:probable phosphoglycerate mutase